MSAGLIKDGKLYVALQRLQNFAATQSGYIAVIDTATNTEIDTGKGSNGLKGHELPVNDPVRLALVPNSAHLLVVAGGVFDNSLGRVAVREKMFHYMEIRGVTR